MYIDKSQHFWRSKFQKQNSKAVFQVLPIVHSLSTLSQFPTNAAPTPSPPGET
jgi:hypothetical protein